MRHSLCALNPRSNHLDGSDAGPCICTWAGATRCSIMAEQRPHAWLSRTAPQVNYLLACSRMLIQAKRRELIHKAKERAKAEKQEGKKTQ